MNDVRNVTRHVIVPSLASLGMVALYLMPKTTIGCANRGLAASGLAFVATAFGIAMVAIGLSRRRSGREDATWFILSAVLLLLPALLLLGPLG